MLTIPKTKKVLTHAVVSNKGVLMGAHSTEGDANAHAKELNESRNYIDRMNGPYHVEPYRNA
ncbi:hypothetical protein [Burkholderia sp. MBR-1]|uniref:hypothetical protein n=1 Tax=Burkholderia sp. MBR-1 TaxID=2732364 RepID=UPI0015EE9744|nr:hypothetical protein [Burkholderia sp. MBR-1]QMI49916.1 hypothetical protein MBR110_31140 [Burkholderia sp. MBR-1]